MSNLQIIKTTKTGLQIVRESNRTEEVNVSDDFFTPVFKTQTIDDQFIVREAGLFVHNFGFHATQEEAELQAESLDADREAIRLNVLIPW